MVKARTSKHWRIVMSLPSGSVATPPKKQRDVAIAVALLLEGLEEGPVAGPSSI